MNLQLEPVRTREAQLRQWGSYLLNIQTGDTPRSLFRISVASYFIGRKVWFLSRSRRAGATIKIRRCGSHADQQSRRARPDYFHKFSPTGAAAFVDRASPRMSNPVVALYAVSMCIVFCLAWSKKSLRKLVKGKEPTLLVRNYQSVLESIGDLINKSIFTQNAFICTMLDK